MLGLRECPDRVGVGGLRIVARVAGSTGVVGRVRIVAVARRGTVGVPGIAGHGAVPGGIGVVAVVGLRRIGIAWTAQGEFAVGIAGHGEEWEKCAEQYGELCGASCGRNNGIFDVVHNPTTAQLLSRRQKQFVGARTRTMLLSGFAKTWRAQQQWA